MSKEAYIMSKEAYMMSHQHLVLINRALQKHSNTQSTTAPKENVEKTFYTHLSTHSIPLSHVRYLWA